MTLLGAELGFDKPPHVLLTDGHSVRIIDIDAEQIGEVRLREIFKSENPALVGVTATTPVFPGAVGIARIAKECCSAATVIGGIHASIMPEECASCGPIDFTVVGEGEWTICELAKCLEHGGDFSEIRGLVSRQGGRIVRNQERTPIEDLDSLPFPARHLFKGHRYSYPDAIESVAVPMITSRGCPGNCSFCTAKFLHGRRFRCRSAENVLDEIELVIREYGAREIHFRDDNFITNRNRVFAIRDGILARKIKCRFAFPNGIRADFINKEILKALKDSGTYSVAIGVESGNQRILDIVQKGTRLQQIEEAFAIAKELGIETWGFFLIGIPGEDRGTINDTIDFSIRLDPDIAKFHVLKPFPKSAVFEQLDSKGLIIDHDYAHYGIHTGPVHRLETLSRDDLLDLQRQAYRRFYLRPSKIFKEIIRLKSWNRLRLNARTGVSLISESIFRFDHG